MLAVLATPPTFLTSDGSLSKTITETAPASSAICACSTVVTSITTPFFNICANPRLSVDVPRLIEYDSIFSLIVPFVSAISPERGIMRDDPREIYLFYYFCNYSIKFRLNLSHDGGNEGLTCILLSPMKIN